jgi:hypothetical protein
MSEGNGVEKTPATCASCCYFVMSGDNVTGNCHEGKPDAIPIYELMLVPVLNEDGTLNRIEGRQTAVGSQSLWPPVRPTIDWCGEHPLLRHLGEYEITAPSTEAPPKKRPGRPRKHVEEVH